jgi:CubicO group peptidase (beta-lactamase class C family)
MRGLKYVFAGLLALAGLAAVAQQVNPLAPQPQREQAAAPVPAPAVPSSEAGPPQLTAQDVNAWLDGFMPYALGEADVAGAVVTVVSNGQVITERGFGYADVARRTPVDPRRTLFRPGSVSKLITWTAVMQQVEQGRLNLDADVNTYLDFRIPEYQGRPVTLRQIMTHTAGFEESLKDLIGNDRAAVPPYGELVKRWIPLRIFAPGTTPAYSNYATSLAGYIVERVSHEPFDDYVERHIFVPLGMRNSTMRQPLPANMRPQMATGYRRASGEPVPFEIVGPAPAGSLSSTGYDMARFMMAHLNDGELDGQRILSAETAREMHRTRASYGIGPLDRMLLGFFETNVNGREVIAHLGDTGAFHTSLHLFIDDNTGLYASFNSGGEEGAVNGVRIALFHQFADRYFPGRPDARRVPAETAREHARMMAGNWTASRRPDSSFLNVAELLGQTTLSTNAEGELVTPPGSVLTGRPAHWVEVAPFLWQDLNSHTQLAAVVENGRPVRWSMSMLSAFTVYDRPPTWKNAALLMPLLQLSLAILLLTALLWPTRWLVRRYHKATISLSGRDLLGYRLSRAAAWAILLVLAGWATVISVMFGDLNNLGGGLDVIIVVLQVLTFIAFLGGLAVFLWYAWQVWRGKRRWWARVWSVALVVAGLVMVWLGFAFHLLSFGANY